MQAAVEPAPQTMAQPVALVSPAPQAGHTAAQKGYGFLNASMTSDTATKYSGENVSSMFNMTSPIPTQPRRKPSRRKRRRHRLRPRHCFGLGRRIWAAQSAAATQAAAGGPFRFPPRSRKAGVKPQAVAAKRRQRRRRQRRADDRVRQRLKTARPPSRGRYPVGRGRHRRSRAGPADAPADAALEETAGAARAVPALAALAYS